MIERLQKIPRRSIAILALISPVILGLLAWAFMESDSKTVSVGPYRLKVARTSFQITRGYQGAKYIERQTGILFVAPLSQPKATFWMKDCDVKLDMIFLDSSFRVQRITTAAPFRPDPEAKGQPLYPIYTAIGMLGAVSEELPDTPYVVEVAAGAGEDFVKNGLPYLSKVIVAEEIKPIP